MEKPTNYLVTKLNTLLAATAIMLPATANTQQANQNQSSAAPCDLELQATKNRLNDCMNPAPKAVKKSTYHKKVVRNEHVEVEPPAERISEVSRQPEAPTPAALPSQTTTTVNVNVTVNPTITVSPTVENNFQSKNTNTAKLAQQSTQEEEEPRAPRSSGGLYGRLGGGGGIIGDRNGSVGMGMIEAVAMWRANANGNFGFGVHGAFVGTPHRFASIDCEAGTVPTNSLIVEACAEMTPGNKSGLIAAACAGVQYETSNSVRSNDSDAHFEGSKRSNGIVDLGAGGQISLGKIGVYIMGRIGAVLSRRDAISPDNRNEHTVPTVSLTAGITMD